MKVREHIRLLVPGDEQALEAYLRTRLESSMFLLGNLRATGLVDGENAYQGAYAACWQANQVVGVIAHYWNGNLVLQAGQQIPTLCRAAVRGSGRPIYGVVGPAAQVEIAARYLIPPADLIQTDETEILYSLNLSDLVIPEGLASGWLRGRRSEPRDESLLVDWRIGYCVEAMGDERGPELEARCRRSVVRSTGEGRTWVAERAGQVVACSSFNAILREAVQVGGVWTPPEGRRRGYGRAAVATSLVEARAQGVEKAILFTGESNLAAQKAYQSLGFRPTGDYRLLLFNRAVESPNGG